MKWIFLILIVFVGYMIYTGNMGGAREATQNYVDVRSQKSPDQKATEGRPSPMHSYIEYKNKQENK